MKKIILLVVGFALSIFFAKAQGTSTLFEKYENREGVERVKICPKLLKGASKILVGLAELSSEFTEEEKEIMSLFCKLEKIEILAANVDTVDFYKELSTAKFFKKNNYSMLLEVQDGDKEVHIYSSDDEKDCFSNVLLLLKDKDEKGTVLAEIKGEIVAEDFARLIKITKKKAKKE